MRYSLAGAIVVMSGCALSAEPAGKPGADDAREPVESAREPLSSEAPPLASFPGESGGSLGGGPGDGWRGGFHNDPQYQGLFAPRAPSGAAPGAARPHGGGPRAEPIELAGPTEGQIADAKKAWKNLEQRGDNLLARYQDLYPDEEEANRKACVFSCSGNFNALCGYVDSVCSTGNSIVPLFPGMPVPCSVAKAASCEGHPDACILGCFGAGPGATAAARHPGDDLGRPVRVSPRWRASCHLACKAAEGLSCVAVAGTCAPGTVWTFGGAAVPCLYAVLAACAGSITAGAACSTWCDRG